ncbi:hypothetical protein [Streptomyces griseocarneus]|uniref:hypothetical protein n=1 Tax=Streptomyces griseocarneus TaxID=51201 RepID=UPI00167EDE17|nr:hypothetical protein [Streptomyces griseocarneus]MBZ6477662.1 hypothetical protein [Streptomyces griseocarneus]GHG82054.1 hypothetical protein GCM10018779_64580 [Streptomyces griseocarneus]
MDAFTCVRCDAVLTAPVSRVPYPAYARHTYGNGRSLPVLMESGTYAVDPEPFGPPWRQWSEIDPAEAEARGVFAPVHALSFGMPGSIVMAPGDAHGTVLIPERTEGFCCGLDGRDGPNLACARCGQEVATRVDDCSLWQATWLEPSAVRRVATGPDRSITTWQTLAEERHSTPPVEENGSWSPRWEVEVSIALAHLVAASGGSHVTVPDGPLAESFRRSIEDVLPPGPNAKHAALAGPGLPAPDPAPDILVVPRHPQTGEPWPTPPGVGAVPLAADVWMHLAFHREHPLLPATGRLPAGVARDEPLSPWPWRPLYVVTQAFFHTLARLPAVRQPWLRAIHDGGSAQFR